MPNATDTSIFGKRIARLLSRKSLLVVGLFIVFVLWILSATAGTAQIASFVIDTQRPKPDATLVRHAEEAQRLVPQGIKAGHWYYVGNARSPFPFVVSVDMDWPHSDLHWQPKRWYYFWCLGVHAETPFYGHYFEYDP